MADNTAKAIPAATAAPEVKAPEKERTVPVELLGDIWLSEPGHPDADPSGVRRIRSNIKELNEDGSFVIDKKTKTFVTKTVKVDLPVALAKHYIKAGVAVRMDDL